MKIENITVEIKSDTEHLTKTIDIITKNLSNMSQELKRLNVDEYNEVIKCEYCGSKQLIRYDADHSIGIVVGGKACVVCGYKHKDK